jgi:hypothetical protein
MMSAFSTLTRWIKNLSVFVLTGLGFLIVLELIIWFLIDIKPPQFNPERFFSTDSVLGHYHRPNARGYWYRYKDGSKYWVEINRWGLADSDRTLEKATRRIALVGDSTTENWEMAAPKRSHNVLRKCLNDRFEVLNCGVRGYGTDQTLILLQHIVIWFKPDIVIYNFCINDIQDNSVRTDKPYYVLDESRTGVIGPVHPVKYGDKLPFTLSTLSFRESLEYYLFSSRCVSRALSGLVRPLIHPESLETAFHLRPYLKKYSAEDEQRWQLTLQLINAMKTYCDMRGIRFIAVSGPDRLGIDAGMQHMVKKRHGDRFDFDKLETEFVLGCTRNGIESLGLKNEITKRQLHWRKWFHREDTIHLNDIGVADYCDILSNKLSDLGW